MTHANLDRAALIACRNAARRDLVTAYRGPVITIATNPATTIPEIVTPESELVDDRPSVYTWNEAVGAYVSIPA